MIPPHLLCNFRISLIAGRVKMLTNEQCIEVAEKVWGWDLESWSDYSDCLTIGQEVNSWQGFGRTVEAMEEREFSLIKSEAGIEFYNVFKSAEVIIEPPAKANDIITATHLAALEALKND